MAQFKVRLDTGPCREPLKESPFAVLQGLTVPAAQNNSAEVSAQDAKSTCDSPYRVGRTRKGGLPITLEKRPGGKVVTVIGNVEGDADILLSLLKKRCGAGGAVRGDKVEVQGDHRVAVEVLLRGEQ